MVAPERKHERSSDVRQAEGDGAGSKESGKSGLVLIGAILALAVAAILFAPAPNSSRSPSSTSSSGPDDMTYKAAAKELVRRQLRDPGSAEFGPLSVARRGGSSPAVCGTVNARNAFGGMMGSQRFIAGGAVFLEEQIGLESMDQLWRQSC